MGGPVGYTARAGDGCLGQAELRPGAASGFGGNPDQQHGGLKRLRFANTGLG